VNAQGTINSGPVGNGTAGQAGIKAGYNPGASNSVNLNINGDVTINDLANINFSGGNGLFAFNFGTGNVAINVGQNAQLKLNGTAAAGTGNGIFAKNSGPGNISVVTSAGDVIDTSTTGSAAVRALNDALAAPSSSLVSVIANGTIFSGPNPTGGGEPSAGILAGYNTNGQPQNGVAGNVFVDDFANINFNGAVVAPAGTDGIRAFNYGTGNISVIAEANATIAGDRYGVFAHGHNGGNITIVSNATVIGNGTATGNAGINANTTGTGSIYIDVNGSVSSPVQDIVATSDSGPISIIITNAGTLSGGPVAINATAGTITVDNAGTINGSVTLAGSSGATLVNHGGGIWDMSGASTFWAGSNFIKNNGIINVSGLSSVTATGSLNLYGTGSIILSDGSTFEVNATVTAGETVIFTTTTTSETLKIDHSLTLPFNAAISGLSSNVHDTIDLADLPFGANTSVYYTAMASVTSKHFPL
jgi:hypothetical protein